MTATPPASCSPEAERFRGPMDVPDPPPSPKGRLRYWADTVQEAVAELRRQLRSHDPDRADRALFAIIDVEKTRMRHGRPVSGTSVPYLSDIDDDWGHLSVAVPEKVADPGPSAGDEKDAGPASRDREGAASGEGEAPAEPGRRPVAPASAPDCLPLTGAEAGATKPAPAPLQSWLGESTSVPGVTAAFSDRDDDYSREPGYTRPADWQPYDENARYDAVIDRQRVAFIETNGLYPEDEWPNNPDYFRFKAEPRPHPAEMRWLASHFGTGDDSLPMCYGHPPPAGATPAAPLARLRVWPNPPPPPDTG